MSNPIQTEIQQLTSLRKQIFWWRTGATLATVAVVGGCLFSLNAAVRGLTTEGPRQQEFTQAISKSLQEDIMPSVQTLASQTITEIQPQIREEFAKLNERVPELTQATQKELSTLQEELPKSGEKALDEAFSKILTSREEKIRAMYPDVTEAQLTTFVENLRKAGEQEMREANQELFAPHQASLASILDHMHKISSSEAGDTKGQNPTWEMGMAVLDVVRADLKDAQSGAPSGLAPATDSKGSDSAKGGKK